MTVKVKGYHFSELTSKYQVTYSNGYYLVPQEKAAAFKEELKQFNYLAQ
jgi:hypothetical protein